MYVSQWTGHLKGIQLDSTGTDVRLQGISDTDDDEVKWQVQLTLLEYKKAPRMTKQEGKFQVMRNSRQKALKNGTVNMSEFQEEYRRSQTQVLKVQFIYNFFIY